MELRRLIPVLLFAVSAWGASFTCTSSGAGNLSDPSKWTNCNSTYPHNNGSDTYRIIANHAITQDVASLTLGASGAPLFGHVGSTITTVAAGSGYNTCTATISGGTANFGALARCDVVNGQAIPSIVDRGTYTAGTPTIAITQPTNPTIAGASTTKGNPTTLVVNTGSWTAGSTQSITIAGATGTGWTGLNATWTATVVSVNWNSAGALTTITVPFNSSSLSGTPGGTITVTPGTTASYTLSYVAGGGTAAAQVGTGGSLTFAAGTVTTFKEDVAQVPSFNNTGNAYVWNGGSAGSPTTAIVDSSGAAAGTIYTFGIGTTATNTEHRKYATSGCAADGAATTCLLKGVDASHPTRITAGTAAGGSGHYISMDYMGFQYVGDAASPWIDGYSNRYAYNWSLTNSYCDTCGRLRLNNSGSGQGIVFDHNLMRNTAGWVSAEFSVTTGKGASDVWSLQYNSFDKPIYNAYTSQLSSVKDFTVQHNYFGGTPFVGSWASWNDNFMRVPGIVPGATAFFIPSGSMSSTYGYLDVDSQGNPHFMAAANNSSNYTIDGFIGGFSGHNTDDSGEWIGLTSPLAGVTNTIKNSIFLCDSTGVGSSEIIAFGGAVGSMTSVLHNTWCGGYNWSGNQFGAVQTNETVIGNSNILTMKSNLIWSANPSVSMKVDSMIGTGLNTDVCTPTNCDYNAGYNIASIQTNPSCSGCTNQGRGYAGKFSATPGAHDVDGQNPNFLDRTRKVENFDVKYMGFPFATVWSSGGTYAFGDITSNSHASMYGGETFNYRCINLSGCTGLGAPGVPGTAWRDNWEWAALYRVREANYARAQYTDAAISCTGCYVVQALNNWVTAGFTPQSAVYKGTAHDGGDIGAVVAVVLNATRSLMAPILW